MFTNKQENGTHFELSHSESLFLLRKIILSMQEGESRLRSFVRISPAVEKILSDGTDVPGTAKYSAIDGCFCGVFSCSISVLQNVCLSLKWFNIFVVPPVYVSSVSHNLHFTVLLSAVLFLKSNSKPLALEAAFL